MQTIIQLIINIFNSIFKTKIINTNYSDEEISSNVTTEDLEEVSFYNYIKNIYLNSGVEWDNEINIFGLRDISNMKESIFNDYICIAKNDIVYAFKGTCDPSAYWTLQGGFNKDGKGVAHLCLGYYKNAYRVGLHWEYEALVQTGGKVKIWRDGNNNFRQDNNDIVEEGYFGINIHRASEKYKVKDIGRYSAGCQVIWSPKDFKKFINIIKSSKKYQKNKKSKFSYFLLDIKTIDKKYLDMYV